MLSNGLPAVVRFQDTPISIIDRQGKPWVAAADLSRALGYGRSDEVSRIYGRHADEFSDDMALTASLAVKGFGAGESAKPTRLFSPRGCHLVAMFARTPKAKAFRRWVLDVLDRLAAGEPAATEGPMIRLPELTSLLSQADRRVLAALKTHPELAEDPKALAAKLGKHPGAVKRALLRLHSLSVAEGYAPPTKALPGPAAERSFRLGTTRAEIAHRICCSFDPGTPQRAYWVGYSEALALGEDDETAEERVRRLAIQDFEMNEGRFIQEVERGFWTGVVGRNPDVMIDGPPREDA